LPVIYHTNHHAKRWAKRAEEEEAIGSDADAVLALVIARKFTAAVTLGMSVLRKNLREATNLTDSVKKLLQALKYVRATDLEAPLRSSFQCHMLWYTAHEAAVLHHWEIAWSMLRLLSLKANNEVAISVLEMKFQEIFFK